MQDGLSISTLLDSGGETGIASTTSGTSSALTAGPESLWLAVLEGQVAAVQANRLAPQVATLAADAQVRQPATGIGASTDAVTEPPLHWLRQVMTQLAAGGNAKFLPVDERADMHVARDIDTPSLPVTGNAPLLQRAAPPPSFAPPQSHPPPLPSPLSPGFGEAFAERVQWLAGKGVQEARIDINPREFGPIEIRIRMDANGANVQIDAAHAQTRQAMAGALPRLGEMFAAAGMLLNDVKLVDNETKRATRTRAVDRESDAELPFNEGLVRRQV